MRCQQCQFENLQGVPFCDQCGAALFKSWNKKQSDNATLLDSTGAHDSPRGLASWRYTEYEQVLLALLPMTGEPTKNQQRSLASLFDMELYDARIRLSTAVPRILHVASGAEIRAIAEAFEALAIPFVCAAADDILSPFECWPVEHISLEGDILETVGIRGHREVDLSTPCLLILGRIEQVSLRRQTRKRGSRSGSFGAPREGSDHKLQRSTKRIGFIHLYERAQIEPLNLYESSLNDYSFLGEQMTPSASQNFNMLAERLARAPGVTVDDTIRQHTALIRDGTLAETPAPKRRASRALTPASGTGGDRLHSNERMVNQVSRLIYHGWR